MEMAPRLDASRPSNLRLAAFGLTAAGALLMGIGSLETWVTYGLKRAADLPTVVPGTDDVAGRIVLAGSIIVLIAVITSRFVTTPRRRILAWIVVAAGVTAIAASVWFILTADDRYVAAMIRGAVDLENYADVGIGPWLAIAGGVLSIVGGLLTLSWASRIARTPTPLPPH